MLAFCPQCRAKVSVVFVLANDVARRELADHKTVEVIHITPQDDHHVWRVGSDDHSLGRSSSPIGASVQPSGN
jgi:hypothetical protein